ncbi:MATE family efflux transporter [Lentibacillus sp. N15]|uniref:MATE family efflux transporter n=1 Tax=Lentibacillus songyuanensis TaxID=3136161 RepID=UPI0031BAC1EC
MEIAEKSEPTNQSGEQRELGSEPIGKLFPKYTIPAIFSGLFFGVQVIFDGMFLGNGVGPEALTTIAILFPYFVLITALSNLFGNGGASICAVEVGKGNKEKAKKILGQSIAFSLAITLTMSIISFLLLPFILNGLGARGEIVDMAMEFMKVYLIFFPFMTTGYTLFYFARADERPLLALLALFIPPVLAILTEYILIFKLQYGIVSSAIAVSIELGPSFLLIFYFLFGRTDLRLNLSDFRMRLYDFLRIAKVGFPSCAIQLTTFFSVIIVNNILAYAGANSYEVGAYGINNAYIYYVLLIVGYSFGIGIQPIVSYNFGNKSFDRVKSALKYGCIWGFGIMTLILIACIVFIEPLAGTFCGGDSACVGPTKIITQKFTMGLSIATVAMVISYYYQALEKTGRAVLIVVSRKVFLFPLIFVFFKAMGVDGIWYAFPLAEVSTCFVAMTMIRKDLRKLRIVNVVA